MKQNNVYNSSKDSESLFILAKLIESTHDITWMPSSKELIYPNDVHFNILHLWNIKKILSLVLTVTSFGENKLMCVYCFCMGIKATAE